MMAPRVAWCTPQRSYLCCYLGLLGRCELPRTRYSRTSENSPSRDCLESPNGLHFVAPLACTTVRNGTFLAASRCQRKRHSTRTATFQTVSLSCERVSEKGLVAVRCGSRIVKELLCHVQPKPLPYRPLR